MCTGVGVCTGVCTVICAARAGIGGVPVLHTIGEDSFAAELAAYSLARGAAMPGAGGVDADVDDNDDVGDDFEG